MSTSVDVARPSQQLVPPFPDLEPWITRVGEASKALSTCEFFLSLLLSKKVMWPAISIFYLCDYPKGMCRNLDLWANVGFFSPKLRFTMIFLPQQQEKKNIQN